MNRAKKNILIILIVIVALTLLIGSFFLRDLALRSGLAEYEKREIVSVYSKYKDTIKNIAESGKSYISFSVTANHGGLFEKSEIIADENGEKLLETEKEAIDVLCHTYCYSIYGRENSIYFTFNKSGSKMIVCCAEMPEKVNEKDDIEKLDEGWYYVEYITA